MTASKPPPDVDCTGCPVRADSFCSTVPEHGLGTLSRSRRPIRFSRRQTIACEGAPALFLFNVVSGIVKLYRSLSDGRTQIIGFRFPGDFFGVSETEKYTTTGEAITFVEVCRFPRSKLKRLMNLFPDLQTSFVERSYRHLAALEDQIVLLGRMTAKEKIVGFLLRYSAGCKEAGPGTGRQIDLPMTRTEMADFLGLTTETVSRVLTSLTRQKLITIHPSHSVRLIDVDSLRRISGR